jgi:pyruvate,water dikinase
MTNNIHYTLALDDERAGWEAAGGKGAALTEMVRAGLPVPDGFHVTTAAYRAFAEENDLGPAIHAALAEVDLDQPASLEKTSLSIGERFQEGRIPPEIAGAIANAYGNLPGTEPVVAVRSSATAEDMPRASFAGQQESFLNIEGSGAVLEAVKRCWASLWTARAIGYRARQDLEIDDLSLAVVVQCLVPAEAAGILFTANPMTGDRDQALINAAWGLGEAVVGGEVTPDSYTIHKKTGEIIEREIADKEIMTVREDGGTRTEPVPTDMRRAPVLNEQQAAELVQLGLEIEELYGDPRDIEWALADGEFAILQARPITGLPEAYVPPPDQWEVPDPKGRYMRASIIDMMPNPLSPLFATMGVDIYNESILEMLEEITGAKEEALPKEIILTLQDFAYMTVNFSAREWWSMAKMVPKFPKLLKQGPKHFREVALPEYKERVERLERKSIAEMPAREIWQDAHELTSAAMDHLAILQVDTLGAAAGSEGLFTTVYEKFFQGEDDPPAAAFVMGYDSTPIRSEKSLYDLAQWAGEQPGLKAYLLETKAGAIAARMEEGGAPEGLPPEVWEEWARRFEDHLDAFGYILFDLDFAEPVPAEDPGPQLETVKMYLRGEGANPHERQERLEQRRIKATEDLLQRARGLRGWAVRRALRWAQNVGEVREDSIASIGLAYPRLRRLLKELGQRMAETGAIREPEEIFWLQEAEIEEVLPAVEEGQGLASMADVIEERQDIRQAEARIMPPSQIPHAEKYLGLPVDIFMPGEGGMEGDRLEGVGASGGRVTGTAYVLHGPEDFDRMQQGGILVAKLTTPAWTPLFAMASGVVTDIGGPLSHGSIVAREYGIPAVLGTGSATRVIRNGQEITVDGTNGYITLSAEGGASG